MATIITKNSSTPSSVPTAGDLVQGELAVNVADKRLFTEDSTGSVVELGINPTSITTGAITASGTVTANSSLVSSNVTITGGSINGSMSVGGTWTAAATWTLPAFTLNGTVTANGQSFSGTIADLGTVTTVDIDGGTLDNVTIGGSTPAAGSFTTLSASGNITVSGTVDGRDIATDGAKLDNIEANADVTDETNVLSALDGASITTASPTTSDKVLFQDVTNSDNLRQATINDVLLLAPPVQVVDALDGASITTATVAGTDKVLIQDTDDSDNLKTVTAQSIADLAPTDPTLATQTKTYISGEASTLTLSSAVTSGVPVVSVTKEVPQTGVTNNQWDVNSTAENYTRVNSAPATTLDFVGFDVSTASFVDSFSVAGQDSTPQAIAFNADGTKMFIVGNSSDAVNEYTLGTGFDVSTATYSQNFSVSSQETAPTGIAFNTDGTKMFIVGIIGQDVNEYTLGTGFDVSTATYSQNFSVSSQETQPQGIAFNTDGTKMFIVGNSGDEVNEYTLGTGFDVSTASYSQNFSVSSQDTSPSGIAFNTDGTKMFIVGGAGDDVNEYTLSSGFDVSTASYFQNFSVSAQEISPQGIAFNTDGTKMFVVGSSGDDVNEYDLTPTSVTLGTGSFTSADVGKTIYANSGELILTSTGGAIVETTAPSSYAQVASGNWEMYAVVYNTTDGDLELSQAITSSYDISSATFTQSKDLSAQSDDGVGLAFKPDGTKMFVVDKADDRIYQYSLSTAFDISTATYDSVSFNTATNAGNPQSMAFNSDGTKMFVLSINNDEIEEFTLGTAYSLSSVTHVDGFSVSSQESTPTGMHFKPDGTKVFIIGEAGDRVYEYALSTAFDISSASYTGQSNSVGSQDNTPSGLTFNAAGTSFFVTGEQSDKVHEYSLTTAFDVVSAGTFVRTLDSSSKDGDMGGLTFDTDGVRLFLIGRNSNSVHEYSTGAFTSPSGYHAAHTTTSTDSTYWTDINSMTADEAAGDGNVYYAVSTDDRTTWSIADNTDGIRDIVRNNAGTWEYNSNGTYGSETWTAASTNTELSALQEAMEGASAGYDLANASYDSVSFDVSSQDTQPQAIAFNADGTKMFIVGETGQDVNEYTLSTAFNVSTASYSQAFSVSSQELYPQGIAFNSDGTKMFIVGTNGDDVNEYTLGTGFDVSTASFVDSFSVSAQDTSPRGVAFSTDGTKMFVVGITNDSVYEYTLSTAFDVSTSSFVDSFSVSAQDTAPLDLTFNSDGTKMYIIGSTGDDVNEYTLGTGFDISTATYAQNFSVASQETSPTGITFNSDGTKMFIVGSTTDSVYQYSTAAYPNQMDKTQLEAVTDANQFTLGNDLDLAIIFNLSSGSTVPSSDGVSINYDANTLNEGAIIGTDYDFDFPATDKVRITALADNNLKVRVV